MIETIVIAVIVLAAGALMVRIMLRMASGGGGCSTDACSRCDACDPQRDETKLPPG